MEQRLHNGNRIVEVKGARSLDLCWGRSYRRRRDARNVSEKVGACWDVGGGSGERREQVVTNAGCRIGEESRDRIVAPSIRFEAQSAEKEATIRVSGRVTQAEAYGSSCFADKQCSFHTKTWSQELTTSPC